MSSLRTILCFLVFCGSAWAVNNYYVSTSGSGTACTIGSPCATITQAHSTLAVGTSGSCVAATGWLTVTNAGACVHVASGTYNDFNIETSKSGGASTRVVYISDTRWGAKLNAPRWQSHGSYVDILGFDMTGTGSNFAIAWGPAGGGHQTIQYNYLHDISTSACPQAAVIMAAVATTDDLINGNVIRHAGGPFGSCTGGWHGIYSDGLRTIITNNIISGITGGWAIHAVQIPGTIGPRIISNNTLFDNAGGIALNENNGSFAGPLDYWTIANNIIVNNGVSGTGTQHYGINFYHVTGTHNFVSNNLIYGNLPADYAHHDSTCTGGTPISGSDANGTAGGCPSTNPKSDANTGITFASFQLDTNNSPAGSYDSTHYKLGSASAGVSGGTTNCAASPGISPCLAIKDFAGDPLDSPPSIGAYRGSFSGSVPNSPSGLGAVVN
jgi:hypothetical protein